MGRGSSVTTANGQLLFGTRSAGHGPRPARRPDAKTSAEMIALDRQAFADSMAAVYAYEGREPGWQDGLRHACRLLNAVTQLQGMRGSFYYLEGAEAAGQDAGMTGYRSPLLPEPIMVHLAGCYDEQQLADTVIRVRDRERE